MPAGIWYCTRESVKGALDEIETARTNDQVDAALEGGARNVDQLLMAVVDGLAPRIATKYFDYPSRLASSPSWRLWLNGARLISVSSVTTRNGAATLALSQINLEPQQYGPPYTRIETNLGGSADFDSGATWQRAVAVTGLWGVSDDSEQVGTLGSTLGATAGSTATLAWNTARFGVGDVLRIDDERMTVTERNFVDSTQNLGVGGLDADNADVSVPISDGTGFAVEEIISIDGERMRVVDITGNTLSVRRAWDGSQLAAHLAGADVYALTGVTLGRAVLGTTIAAHTSTTAVYRWRSPGLLAALNRAYAINALLQERSGYARVAGTGENAREFTGRGIAALEADVVQAYGPNFGSRHRSV